MTTPQQPQQQPHDGRTRRHRMPPPESRRQRWPLPAPAQAARVAARPVKVTLTVLGTTDLHGNVYNWDYFKNAEFDDSAHNDIGAGQGRRP